MWNSLGSTTFHSGCASPAWDVVPSTARGDDGANRFKILQHLVVDEEVFATALQPATEDTSERLVLASCRQLDELGHVEGAHGR